MKNLNSHRTEILLLSIFVTASLVGAAAPAPECIHCQSLAHKPSKYRLALRTRLTDNSLLLHVSIPTEKFDQDDLIALACQFKKDLGTSETSLVRVFDNFDSAKRYVSRWAQERPSTWQEDEKSQRAIFSYDSRKHECSIGWFADPLNKTGETTVHLCP